MASAFDIVNAAYQLYRARVKYRQWQPGNSIPMWLDDGLGNNPPTAHLVNHLVNVGVMGADLINFALVKNGLPPGGGTGSFADYLVDKYDFDPSSPGQQGAIALRPYQGPNDDGSIALYVDGHRVIQSLPSAGVTDRYTDEQTDSCASQGWPRYGFTIYGCRPGVSD